MTTHEQAGKSEWVERIHLIQSNKITTRHSPPSDGVGIFITIVRPEDMFVSVIAVALGFHGQAFLITVPIHVTRLVERLNFLEHAATVDMHDMMSLVTVQIT